MILNNVHACEGQLLSNNCLKTLKLCSSSAISKRDVEEFYLMWLILLTREVEVGRQSQSAGPRLYEIAFLHYTFAFVHKPA